MQIKVPTNQIVAVNRRDEIQHPYLESLFRWAVGLQYYNFGTSMGKENGIINQQKINVNIRDNNQVTGMMLKGILEFNDEFTSEIIQSMGTVGYELTQVGVAPNQNSGVPLHFIFVKEADRDSLTFQHEMSQGMFRVLSLIIQIIYSQHIQQQSTIIIDDIGEGLDFERSVQIISLLIKKSEHSQFQLLMSTNDKFVMNKVALKYWQVIKRSNNVCKLFNFRNSESTFKDFEYTGLSNFDFFTTEFYEKGFEKE